MAIAIHEPRTCVDVYRDRVAALISVFDNLRPSCVTDKQSYVIGSLAGMVIAKQDELLEQSQVYEQLEDKLRKDIAELKAELKELRDRTR